MNKTAKITILSIMLVIAVVFLLFFILFKPIKKRLYIKNFKKYVGNLVYKIALNNDYYLINELALPLDSDNNEHIHIDHLLFGEKFIYVIADRSYHYLIEGKEFDHSWILNKPKQKKMIDNPLIMNAQRVNKLAQLTSFNPKYLISIVVVNDESLLQDIELSSQNNFVVTYSKLKKLIKTLESRDVPKIKDNQLKYAVKDIAELNQKAK